MTDRFALLDEPRQPWIDPEALKAKFLTLASAVHPDRVHSTSEEAKEQANRRYADLNEAFQCLGDSRSRLLHLLELESGSKPKDVQRIPPGTMDLFVEIGQACRSADAFLAERSAAASPLLKVRFFEHGQEWVETLQAMQQIVNQKRDALHHELQSLNARWEKAPTEPETRRKALPLERLEEIYRILSYTSRWTEQIQERIVHLSF